MISGFFTTIQNDIMTLCDACSSNKAKRPSDDKVGHAAVRIIAAVGMVIAVGIAASALGAIVATPVGALIGLGIAALIYSVMHDVFIIARNKDTELSASGVGGALKDLGKQILNGLDGKEPKPPVTRDTFWRPVWNCIINEAQARA